MKKIFIVKLGNACDPDVTSLDDVLELVCATHVDDTYERECKSKKKSSKSALSKEELDVISAVAKNLGISVEELEKDVIEEKIKANAKKATEAARAKSEAKSKEEFEKEAKFIKGKLDAAYTTGAIDGYEKGFKQAIDFIRARLNKTLTAALSDLNDMAKWNFKDGTIKEDAVFKK